MRKHLAYIALLLFFVGCKKEESYEYYYKKAEEKRLEIENLIKTFPCGDLSNWKIDVIPASFFNSLYFPIAALPNAEYLRLKKEYVQLIEKAVQLDNRNIYFDYLPNPAIAIECAEGHPKVMTARDYNLENATSLLKTKIGEIETLTAINTCTGTEDWEILQLIKDCKNAYIPIDKNNKALLGKINELQQIIWALQMRIVSLDYTKNNCFKYDFNNKPFKVVCENNKPVIKTM